MKKLLGLMLVFVFTVSAFAANPFSDVPFSHWAYDAVAKLSAKGIITGFPDGTFKGQRKVTRYELAMILARLMAKMDGGISMPNLSADDKRTVEKLTVELADELSLLGVKVTALEDEVAVLKDDVAMIKEGGSTMAGSDGKVKFDGSYHLYYMNEEDDTKTQTNNWYNELYTAFTFKPTMDSKVYIQNYTFFDWNTLAGADYGLTTNTDSIKRVYLELSDFDLMGLASFNKATFGRNDFRLGNGLFIDARMTGINLESDDYTVFMFTDNGVTSSFANIWGIDYKLQKEMNLYVIEARNTAGTAGTAASSVTAGDKMFGYGLTYNADNFCFEYLTGEEDKSGLDGDAYRLEFKATDDINFAYTVREAGTPNQVANFGAPASAFQDEVFSRISNTETMFLSYKVNDNFKVCYESSDEETATAAKEELTAMTLAYSKEIKPGIDMNISYSTVSYDNAVAGAAVSAAKAPTTLLAGTLAEGNDVNQLRFNMSVNF